MLVYSSYLLGSCGNIGLILRGYRGFIGLTVFYFFHFLLRAQTNLIYACRAFE